MVVVAELFAFAVGAEVAPVVPAGAVAAAVTALIEVAAALPWVVLEAAGGGAALAAEAGGEAMYCESNARVAAMALGSVLPLSSLVLLSSLVGCESADFAGAGAAALGSAFVPAACASSCRKLGASPGAWVPTDPLAAAGLAEPVVPFDPAVPPVPLDPPLPPAPLPAQLDRPLAPLDGPPALLDLASLDELAALLDRSLAPLDWPAVPLDRAELLEAAGLLAPEAARLDPGAAAPGVVPEPAAAFGGPPPSRPVMPPLEPRDEEAAPVEAAGEEETDSRATPMHSVRWAALREFVGFFLLVPLELLAVGAIPDLHHVIDRIGALRRSLPVAPFNVPLGLRPGHDLGLLLQSFVEPREKHLVVAGAGGAHAPSGLRAEIAQVAGAVLLELGELGLAVENEFLARGEGPGAAPLLVVNDLLHYRHSL